MARATSPEPLASSTKSRRYRSPASRPFGTPMACWTAMNRPSSMRDPGRIDPEERDVPGAGLRGIHHGRHRLVRDELDRRAEPPRQLARQVDRHAARLAGGRVLPGEDEIAVVDPGAELPGRREVGV